MLLLAEGLLERCEGSPLGRRRLDVLRRALRRSAELAIDRGREGADAFATGLPDGALSAGWSGIEASGGSFGERLQSVTSGLFDRGYERVVLVVSDTPSLHARDVRRAVNAARGTLVAGPAPDGGLYLLSLERAQAGFLDRIPWQSDRVRRRLRDLCRDASAGAPRALVWLRPRADLDAPSDLSRRLLLLERLCHRHGSSLFEAAAWARAAGSRDGAPASHYDAARSIVRRGPPA